MNNSSDSDKLHSEILFLKMREKSTDDLISIWVENNRKLWTSDEFDAIYKVLSERLKNLPQQKSTEDIKPTPKPKWYGEGETFERLSYHSQFRGFSILLGIIILCLVFLIANAQEQNSRIFWEFSLKSKVSDIEKLELQKLDENGDGVGEIIVITDRNSLNKFVSILNKIEENPRYHAIRSNEFKLTIWRTKNNIFGTQHSIELRCYTLKKEENTIFVNTINLQPALYGFGSGNTKFISPELIDWLNKNGLTIN